MSSSQVSLTIEGQEVTVPEGTLLVNAAKEVGVYIPVFCYHPKLESVGMCRMCLVEIGRPKRDRETGDFVRDEAGEPVIEFGPKLETACTTPVGEGWVVRTASEKALAGQAEIVEFLLTSHPLDCPVCDKGGECPLQELTMDFGAGKSRFHYGDKMHLGKHVPLGDLIYLDQERCIQCARCTRFQDDVVADPVIGFEERGRELQIVTYSDPGFDSYFSGNTTDICPVGALTTADFRFEARPWEMKAAASVCSQCPVGCNTMINTRRQPNAEGRVTVQRVMPRQNEHVNEIWLCDKGRFAHHYADSRDRLTTPLVREEDGLVEASWEEALTRAVEGLQDAGEGLVGVAGGRASNEDFFTFRHTVEGIGGRVRLADEMAGGDLVGDYGLGTGSDLGQLGEGDAILVIASDLHEEAPIWWLRVKQAAERGATLVVANARESRLDAFAAHTLGYPYPRAAQAALSLLTAVTERREAVQTDVAKAAESLAQAENLVVFYGREGVSYENSLALAQGCARLLAETGHTGRANNGLVAVWPHNNTQGAWDVGLRPDPQGLRTVLGEAEVLWLMAVDPAGDDEALAEVVAEATFVVLQELYLTETAELADVVLPAQSYLEREGTFTSGERRLQRFYPALPPTERGRPDWRIATDIAAGLGVEIEGRAPAPILSRIGEEIPAYKGITYQDLAEVEPQWPKVGGEDLYFGGTAYANNQGLGVRLASGAESGEAQEIPWPEPVETADGDWLLVPVDRLYDLGVTVTHSEVLHPRLPERHLEIGREDAERLGLEDGGEVELRRKGAAERLRAEIRSYVPAGTVLIPRSMGVPLDGPEPIELATTAGSGR